MDQPELREILGHLINRCLRTDYEFGDLSIGKTERDYHLSSHYFDNGVTCFWLEQIHGQGGALNLTADGWRIRLRYDRDQVTPITIWGTEEAMVAARLGGYI